MMWNDIKVDAPPTYTWLLLFGTNDKIEVGQVYLRKGNDYGYINNMDIGYDPTNIITHWLLCPLKPTEIDE